MNVCWLFYELGFSAEQYNELISHVYREALKYNFDSAYIEVRSTVRNPNTGKMIVSTCGVEIECHTRLERFYCEVSGSSYLKIVGMAIFLNNKTIDSINQIRGLLNNHEVYNLKNQRANRYRAEAMRLFYRHQNFKRQKLLQCTFERKMQ